MLKGKYSFDNGKMFLRTIMASSPGSGVVSIGTYINSIGTGEATIGVIGKSPYAGPCYWAESSRFIRCRYIQRIQIGIYKSDNLLNEISGFIFWSVNSFNCSPRPCFLLQYPVTALAPSLNFLYFSQLVMCRI
jgi:hypothetical protein